VCEPSHSLHCGYGNTIIEMKRSRRTRLNMVERSIVSRRLRTISSFDLCNATYD